MIYLVEEDDIESWQIAAAFLSHSDAKEFASWYDGTDVTVRITELPAGVPADWKPPVLEYSAKMNYLTGEVTYPPVKKTFSQYDHPNIDYGRATGVYRSYVSQEDARQKAIADRPIQISYMLDRGIIARVQS